MPFQILPAIKADVDEITEIFVACSTSPRIMLETRNVKPEHYRSWYWAGVVAMLDMSDPDGEIVYMKIFDEESGKIIAFCQWGFSSQASKKDADRMKVNPLPEGYDMVLSNKYMAETAAMTARNPIQGDYYTVLELVTSPSFQRRGAASMLMKWGLDRADKTRMTTILYASPSGFPLYKSLGFREVDKLEVLLEDYGGEGTHVHVYMVREPDVFG